jgi:hypothetical protein
MDEYIIKAWQAARKTLAAHEFTTLVFLLCAVVGVLILVRLGVPEIVRNDPAAIEESYYWGAWTSCVIIGVYQTGSAQVAGQMCAAHIDGMYSERVDQFPKPDWWEWPLPGLGESAP